jgi:hypothetical protein
MIGRTNAGGMSLDQAMIKGTADATITAADVLSGEVGYGANGQRVVGTFEGSRVHEQVFDNQTTPQGFDSREITCGFRPRFVILEGVTTSSGSLHTRVKMNTSAFKNLTADSVGTVTNIGVTYSDGTSALATAEVTEITSNGYKLRIGKSDSRWNSSYVSSLKVTAIE